MKTVIVQLPEDEAQFLEAYAKEHATSIAELLARYARRLQRHLDPHPENLKFTGTVPAEVDVRAEHRRHIDVNHSGMANPAMDISKNAETISPSPGGEGRGEGGR